MVERDILVTRGLLASYSGEGRGQTSAIFELVAAHRRVARHRRRVHAAAQRKRGSVLVRRGDMQHERMQEDDVARRTVFSMT